MRFLAFMMPVLVSGCATLSVSSHQQPGLDLAPYHTFDWGPSDALPVGDPRLDGDPSFNDWVQGAVERGLAARGLTLVPTGVTPDLLVHYHAHISERIDVGRVDAAFGSCAGGEDCAPEVTVYEAGTLVIDLVDAESNQVIWRGWAQDAVEDELEDPDAMETTIEEAVARMLARLPRSM
jgi:hypothetical protein